MKENIDCLLIGSYNFEINKQEKILKIIGADSSVFRNSNIRYLNHEGKPYETFEFFEYLHDLNGAEKFVNLGETLSNTIAYLGSYLNRRGFSFDYIISFLKQKDRLIEILENNNVLSIAIITTFYGNPFPIKELISFIKKYNKKAKIIIGGPYINSELRFQTTNANKKLFLSNLNADFYVDSPQGEETLEELLKALKDDSSFDNVFNLYYKSNGDFIETKTKQEYTPLEDNRIDWHLFTNDLPEMLFVRTSLSCPFSCSFCDFPTRMGKYKYTSIEFIEKELDAIASSGKVKYLRFIDDTLNIPKSRFKDLLMLMINKKYNFKWSSFYRCQFADEEIVQLMKESGCEAVHLGIESGSQQVLDNMNKKAKIDDFKNGIDLLNKYDIISFATLILGFPGETKATIEETITFLNQHPPTFCNLFPWYCSPMTPIWEDRDKYGLSGWAYNWKHNTMDANMAMDALENMIINKSIIHSTLITMLPDYIPVFLHNGYTLEQLKTFFNLFNEGVKEKLINKENKNVSDEIFQEMKLSLLC